MMRNNGLLVLALAGIFSTATILAHAQDKPSPDEYTSPLFDGRSLQGWHLENDCEVEAQDGVLLLKAGNGWLRSDLTYRDFVLHVEWKALQARNYDAGIYIRSAAEGKPFPKPSYQVNLLQGSEGNIGTLPGATSTGLVKAGDWNTFDIAVKGETVALEINGRAAYNVGGLTRPEGYIGFQVEVPKGGQFLIRNVRVTELGYRSLFNGSDLSGWEGAGQPAENCWSVEDGMLVCSGQKGPWLRSNEQYDDFDLRLDYQVSPGGNSGVYVRVPANGSHHRKDETEPPAGVEVQILDDEARQHAHLKPYQYSASVYDIAGAAARVSRPAGEWNTLEINCRGSRISTVHNGVLVVDADAEQSPLLKLRELKGYLGLQNHSTVVRFRHLRIGPPADLSGAVRPRPAVESK